MYGIADSVQATEQLVDGHLQPGDGVGVEQRARGGGGGEARRSTGRVVPVLVRVTARWIVSPGAMLVAPTREAVAGGVGADAGEADGAGRRRSGTRCSWPVNAAKAAPPTPATARATRPPAMRAFGCGSRSVGWGECVLHRGFAVLWVGGPGAGARPGLRRMRRRCLQVGWSGSVRLYQQGGPVRVSRHHPSGTGRARVTAPVRSRVRGPGAGGTVGVSSELDAPDVVGAGVGGPVARRGGRRRRGR